RPAPLALAGAVLQIQNRVPDTSGIVTRGRVHVGTPPHRRDLGIVPVGSHLAVRNILGVVEIDTLFWNLDPAAVLVPAEEGLAAGIVRGKPVDGKPIVVEAGNGRTHGNSPDALLVPNHIERAFAEPVVVAASDQLDLLRAGRGDAETYPQIGVNSR